jgi:predicted aspartyl protease
LGVRVKVELRVGKRKKVVSALVNTGFESEEPDIGIPTEVARELGLWPLKGFRLEEVRPREERPIFLRFHRRRASDSC